MKDFPHLQNATGFPGLGDPYSQYKQSFDYTNWVPGVVIRLFNVAWNDRNIVAFDSESARDEWFDSNSDGEYTFESMLHLQPDGGLKLPLPFESVVRFNYLTVTFPMEPIVPNSVERVRTWCYYIDDVSQNAPSTSFLSLRLDSWQTFGYRMCFTSVQLERGHAPMVSVDVDSYLANPVANNRFLLASDVSYGPDAAIVSHSEFHPFGSGEKIVVFASTLSREVLLGLETARPWDDVSDVSYSDNPARWGHQYEVSGYEWRLGDMDYTGLRTPVEPFSADYLPTGLHMFAVRGVDAELFFRNVVELLPQVMQTIQSMWFVGDDMIEVADAFTLLDCTLMIPEPVHELDVSVELSKEQFGYSDEYSKIAKLYTFPYAALSLSDNSGTTCVVRIENTGMLSLHLRTSMVYPYLKAQAFLTGVNGEGGSTYEWRNINGSVEGTAWNTPFADFMTSFDIPVYALFMDGATDWALHNQNAVMVSERLKSLNSYHMGMRGVNTSYENGVDSANVSYDNTVASSNMAFENMNESAQATYSNGKRSVDAVKEIADRNAETARVNANAVADMSKTNGDLSAGTSKSNADASVLTGYTNGNASAYAGEQNALNSNATAKSNADSSADVTSVNMQNTKANNVKVLGYQTTRATSINSWNNLSNANNVDISNSLGQSNLNADISFMNTQFQLEATAGALTTGGTALAQIASGNVGGAAATVVGGLVGFAKDNAINEATISLNTTKQAHSADFSSRSVDLANGISESINDDQNALNKDVTNANNDLLETNTNNSVNLIKANAARSKTTGDSNAVRSYETSLSNNKRSYDTSLANNERSYDTTLTVNANNNSLSHAVNDRNYETSLTNNKRNWYTQLGGEGEGDVGNLGRNRIVTIDNGTRQRDTALSNAEKSLKVTLNNLLESRESGEFSNKTVLEQSKTVAETAFSQHAVDKPLMLGSNSGDAVPDVFRYRGVQIRVLTQPTGALAMAGDYMLRYGYAYSGFWNVESLQLMKHFTFWKCSEVWFKPDSTIIEKARADVRSMFENGVTVWDMPENIGNVSIYDNWR